MKKSLKEELLQKYDKGLASKTEIDALEKYADQLIKQNPSKVFTSDIEKHNIKTELRKRIAIQSNTILFSWKRIAAGITLLIGVSLLFWLATKNFYNTDMIVIKTGIGERRTISLSDGSTITLNSKSSIEYPENFNESERTVTLSGEAIFSIQKNSKLPFIVKTDHISTKVLGTVFNVNAYAEDSLIQVSLIEGSLLVQHELDTVLLGPLQRSSLDLRSNTFEKSSFEISAATGWKEGDITLSKTSFKQIQNLVMRQYGVKLRFNTAEILEYTVSGKFSNPDLNTFLATICAARSLQFQPTQNGEILILEQVTSQ